MHDLNWHSVGTYAVHVLPVQDWHFFSFEGLQDQYYCKCKYACMRWYMTQSVHTIVTYLMPYLWCGFGGVPVSSFRENEGDWDTPTQQKSHRPRRYSGKRKLHGIWKCMKHLYVWKWMTGMIVKFWPLFSRQLRAAVVALPRCHGRWHAHYGGIGATGSCAIFLEPYTVLIRCTPS